MSTAAPKKKRVLFIINQFFRGGAETALVNLLRTMDSARFDVDLLIFDMIDLPGSLSLIPEIPDWVHVINVAENEKKTAFVKKAVFKLERKLTGTQPFRRGAGSRRRCRAPGISRGPPRRRSAGDARRS